ncbi:hypothetical protein BRC69_02605 [Halobacteriales archaeon QH_6_66_25]|jgi:sugar phosphate permease|nr:MAG: hypothetical protein BRC66_00840 [Halobacteriales archaeon QH_2_66_30]PSP46762.1 MAG: hypothetical protein BRC69_02605 [Halobacteriales archaeon QH_6_66_25]
MYDTIVGRWPALQAGPGLSGEQLLIAAGAVVIAAAALIVVTGYTRPRWTGFATGEEWDSDPTAATEKTERYALIYGVAFAVLGLLFLVAAVLR